jgi:hypothetical protein
MRIAQTFSAMFLLPYHPDITATVRLNVRLDTSAQFLYRAFISCVLWIPSWIFYDDAYNSGSRPIT